MLMYAAFPIDFELLVVLLSWMTLDPAELSIDDFNLMNSTGSSWANFCIRWFLT